MAAGTESRWLALGLRHSKVPNTNLPGCTDETVRANVTGEARGFGGEDRGPVAEEVAEEVVSWGASG